MEQVRPQVEAVVAAASAASGGSSGVSGMGGSMGGGMNASRLGGAAVVQGFAPALRSLQVCCFMSGAHTTPRLTHVCMASACKPCPHASKLRIAGYRQCVACTATLILPGCYAPLHDPNRRNPRLPPYLAHSKACIRVITRTIVTLTKPLQTHQTLSELLPTYLSGTTAARPLCGYSRAPERTKAHRTAGASYNLWRCICHCVSH